MEQAFHLEGKVLEGGYEVRELLGVGGMGAVYSAWQNDLERPVAIKIIRQGQAFQEKDFQRFLREAKILAQLNHPNLVQVYSMGIWQGQMPYLVMEFVQGQALSKVLQERNALSWREALQLGLTLTKALSYAHGKGVLHRDLKPANIILVSAEDCGHLVKLLDFGLAKTFGEQATDTLTGTGAIIGSPAYMAPEIGLGKTIDQRSDIYSLGCTIYECLVGHLPFQAQTALGLLLAHQTTLPERPSSHSDLGQMPNSIDALILRALEKNAEDRFQSMDEFGQAIQTVLDGETLSFGLSDIKMLRGSSGASSIAPSKPFRYRYLLFGAVLAALFVLALGVFLLVPVGKDKALFDSVVSIESKISQLKLLHAASKSRQSQRLAREACDELCAYLARTPKKEASTLDLISSIKPVLAMMDLKSKERFFVNVEIRRGQVEENKRYLETAFLYYLRALVSDCRGNEADTVRYFAESAKNFAIGGRSDLVLKALQSGEGYCKLHADAKAYFEPFAELARLYDYLYSGNTAKFKSDASLLLNAARNAEFGEHNAITFLYLGRLFDTNGDTALSEDCYKRGLAQSHVPDGELFSLWHELSGLYRRQGRREEALVALDHCVDMANNGANYTLLAKLQAERESIGASTESSSEKR